MPGSPQIGIRPQLPITLPPGLVGGKKEEPKKEEPKKDSTTMYLALGGVAVVAAYFLFGRKGPALNPVP